VSYIIISQMFNNRPSGGYGGPPLTKGERAFIAVVVTVVISVFGGFVFWVVGYAQERDRQQHQVQADWDAGKGRPAGVIIQAGETQVTPATVTTVNDYWDECGSKSCNDLDIYRYPQVFPIGSLSLSHGCYTDQASNQVSQIAAAQTTGGGEYTVFLAVDGRSIIICLTSPHQDDNDKVVVWSDDPDAKRP
jgi:predicted metalloprotease